MAHNIPNLPQEAISPDDLTLLFLLGEEEHLSIFISPLDLFRAFIKVPFPCEHPHNDPSNTGIYEPHGPPRPTSTSFIKSVELNLLKGMFD